MKQYDLDLLQNNPGSQVGGWKAWEMGHKKTRLAMC